LFLPRDIVVDEYALYALLVRPPEELKPLPPRTGLAGSLMKLHSHAVPRHNVHGGELSLSSAFVDHAGAAAPNDSATAVPTSSGLEALQQQRQHSGEDNTARSASFSLPPGMALISSPTAPHRVRRAASGGIPRLPSRRRTSSALSGAGAGLSESVPSNFRAASIAEHGEGCEANENEGHASDQDSDGEEEEHDLDHVALLRMSPLLIFVADVRTRCAVSLRSLLTRLIRPAHVAHTTTEIGALDAYDRAAAMQRATERARRHRERQEQKRARAAEQMTRRTAASTDAVHPELVPGGPFELPSPPPLELHSRSPVQTTPVVGNGVVVPSVAAGSAAPIVAAPPAAAAPVMLHMSTVADAAMAAAAAAAAAAGGSGPSAAGLLGADTAGVGALLQSPLLSGSLPRLSPNDRLSQLELLQVAQMRVEEGRARAVFEQRHRRNPNREWQPTVTRHFRRFPV
jgi:hypothetical protein